MTSSTVNGTSRTRSTSWGRRRLPHRCVVLFKDIGFIAPRNNGLQTSTKLHHFCRQTFTAATNHNLETGNYIKGLEGVDLRSYVIRLSQKT
jgi:hypothetical protein